MLQGTATDNPGYLRTARCGGSPARTPLTCTRSGTVPSMACKGSRFGSALPCPAGRSAPGRGGPERRRRPRPDGTGTPARSVLGPHPTGEPRTTAGRSGHHTHAATAGRSTYGPLTSDAGDQRSGVRVSHPTAPQACDPCPCSSGHPEPHQTVETEPLPSRPPPNASSQKDVTLCRCAPCRSEAT
jgi:hypothetical protein